MKFHKDQKVSTKIILDYYRKFLKLTHQVERAVKNGNMENAEKLSEKREKVLNTISKQKNKGIKEKMAAENNGKNNNGVYAKEIRRITDEVMELDRKIEKRIREQMNGVNDKLVKIRQGHKALKGYSPHRSVPRFLDKSG